MTATGLVTRDTVERALAKAHAGRTRLSLPRLTKLTVSIGVGQARENAKLLDDASAALRAITAQQPITARAKKAIAGFKLRQGDVVGLQVTLRGRRMWDFLNRLIMVALPRIRDFHGLARRGFDDQGNYSFGIREHTVFPEIAEEQVTLTHGLGVVLTTTASTKADGIALVEALGVPLVRVEK